MYTFDRFWCKVLTNYANMSVMQRKTYFLMDRNSTYIRYNNSFVHTDHWSNIMCNSRHFVCFFIRRGRWTSMFHSQCDKEQRMAVMQIPLLFECPANLHTLCPFFIFVYKATALKLRLVWMGSYELSGHHISEAMPHSPKDGKATFDLIYNVQYKFQLFLIEMAKPCLDPLVITFHGGHVI